MESLIKKKKKHYIIVSLTLGIIAAGSAALIGVTNMVTRDKIAQNELNSIRNGIYKIYGDSAEISLEKDIENESYSYVLKAYEISVESKEAGYAFRTTGSNMYGKVSLIVGFDTASKFKSLEIITNEQTYAATLVDNYIVPLNSHERDINDVNCGATYGAKLVRDMVEQATKACEAKIWK